MKNDKNENDAIFLIEKIEVGGDGSMDSVVGYCSTKKSAFKMVDKLEAQQKIDVEQWNKHCKKCKCNCESFNSPDTPEAKSSLTEIKNNGCPYAKDVKFEEVFYGDDNESGGFEIMCDKQVTIFGDFIHVVSECKKID